jgi:branched-chain amino acid transport system substrate-binding protein
LGASVLLILSGHAAAQEAWQKEFVLPWVASFSGQLSPWVQECDLGLKMAVEEINASGGIAGRKVVIESYDVASKPAEAVLRVREAVLKGLVVFGPPTSTDGAAGGPAAARAQTPWFGGGSTGSTWATKAENRPWAWMQHLENDELGVLAPTLLLPKLKGVKRIFVIQETKEKAAVGQWKGAEAELVRRGITIIGRATTTLGDVDFTAQVTKAIAAKPDAIWLGCYTNEAGGVIKELRKQGWRGLICSIQGPMTPEIVRIAGAENMDGVLTAMEYYSNASTPASVLQFTKKFRAKHGRNPGVVAALWYDMAWVVKDVFEKEHLTNNPAKREQERAAFVKAMEGKKWNGAGGSYSWKNGAIVKAGFPLIWEKDGELHLLK